jgi:hypothetical protein
MPLLQDPTKRARPKLLASIAIALALATSMSPAFAQEDAQKEANIHFQRAVALYAEADYRAALVEFKRAYELAPHVTVLYNLGQSYYQLQNYAEALATFERFLAEGGKAHRAEVENAIGVLKSRVGKVDVATTTPGWEVAIDDEVVGKTPLAKPLGVSVGKRKITVTKTGEAPQTRVVEVGAGETATVAFQAAPTRAPVAVSSDSAPSGEGAHGSGPWLTVGWIGTGALAAGAVVTGILATSAASDLDDARNRYPGSGTDLQSKADKTTAFTVATDVLVGSALVLAGVSLYFTLTSKRSASATSPNVNFKVGSSAGRLVLGGSF